MSDRDERAAARARVVVTGHDAAGRSVVASDDEVGVKVDPSPFYWIHQLWGADELPVMPNDGVAPELQRGSPNVGGVRFVVLAVPPESSLRLDGSESLVRDGMHVREGDRPGMHFTASVDLVVVIDGEVSMELDDGEIQLRRGDCLVQNGTRHAWRNHGSTTARLGVVALGAPHRDVPGSMPTGAGAG